MGIALTDNTLLSSGIYGFYYKLSQVEIAGNDNIGDAVCLSGAYSGYSCGTLQGKYIQGSFSYDNVPSQYNPTWFDNLRAASYDRTGGDSGGTVHEGSLVKGIHHGSVDGYGVYSHISHVQDDLGLQVVTWK